MSLKELLDLIRREQEQFSASQKLVAAYVLDNYRQVPFLSITALADEIGVSYNTVVKFCNRLGFSKFSEFKKTLSEYACSELVVYNKLSGVAEEDSHGQEANEHIFEQALEDEFTSIRNTLSDSENRENLPKLLDMLDSAKRIYVTGGRASSHFAGLLTCFLRYLDLKVYELEPGKGDFWDQLAMIEPEDLVIAISFPRYTAQVIKGLAAVHQKKIPIVLITDTGLSPALAYADLAFHCTVSSSFYLHCYGGCLALISAISRAAGIHRKQRAAEHIRILEEQLLEGDVFL